MAPLIQSAHVYRCILYYRLYKKAASVFLIPSPLFQREADQWKTACPGAWVGTGSLGSSGSQMPVREGDVLALVPHACGLYSSPCTSLTLEASVCLKTAYTCCPQTSNSFFFLISTHHSNSLKRRKSSNGSFSSLLQTQGMKRLKRSLQVNSEMWRLHIFIFN